MRHVTESRHPDSQELDQMATLDILRLMNREDAFVVEVVGRALAQVAAVADRIAEQLKQGGRLFYVGAGTSGRLGVLDASECPPTFGTDPEMVQGVLAGGMEAFGRAVEHAEDDTEAGASEMDSLSVDPRDMVVGISASGRTAYVLGAVRRAR
ncbi:MAG: N-acetylmuramic acid 6-phosphate etherase, partial [Candidatus Eremiobacterota bacterium]